MEGFGLCVLIGQDFFWAPSLAIVSTFIVDVPSVCTNFMECYLMIGPVDLVYYDCYLKLVRVVMYMIIYEEYVVKAICKNLCVCLGVLDDFIAIRIALSFARRMFWYMSSFSDIWVLMLGLYMRDTIWILWILCIVF